MTALIRYDAARHALQIAHSVDEVKDIRDKAQAMAAYLRSAICRGDGLTRTAREIFAGRPGEAG